VLVGVLYDRAHHRRVDGFGGLAAPMPRFSWLLLFGALAGAGLPGLAGFVGEFLALTGAFTATGPYPEQGTFPAFGLFPVLGALAVVSIVLSAAYLLWLVKRVAYGPLRHPEQAAFADCSARELWASLPLAAGLVLLGVWPSPLVEALRPSCAALAQHVRSTLP
jgi:NADH-quinone oxidoreductase subunit M